MKLQGRKQRRSGAMLVLVALCVVLLIGFCALAIDLGLVAVARSQCQNAADAAAMAGARTLNGDSANNNNYDNAGPNAVAAATANYVMNALITSSQVTVTMGSYSYDTNLLKFVPMIPRGNGEPWTLARVQ